MPAERRECEHACNAVARDVEDPGVKAIMLYFIRRMFPFGIDLRFNERGDIRFDDDTRGLEVFAGIEQNGRTHRAKAIVFIREDGELPVGPCESAALWIIRRLMDSIASDRPTENRHWGDVVDGWWTGKRWPGPVGVLGISKEIGDHAEDKPIIVEE